MIIIILVVGNGEVAHFVSKEYFTSPDTCNLHRFSFCEFLQFLVKIIP